MKKQKIQYRKKTGFILLQIAAYLIVLGGITDLTMTFVIDSLPASHLSFLHIKKNDVSPELKNLDHAFIRAMGTCLIAIGIGALAIIYGPISKGERWSILILIVMVVFGEGGNAVQMLLIESPFFIYPLACLTILLIGAMFWWVGNK
jgi:hypothetical protein